MLLVMTRHVWLLNQVKYLHFRRELGQDMPATEEVAMEGLLEACIMDPFTNRKSLVAGVEKVQITVLVEEVVDMLKLRLAHSSSTMASLLLRVEVL